ncbi:hypothetical protein [Microbacterium sp.]|uniref:hypothetical protein n=1 Tax=Microbacterium sp. TaxID=51671 RepID=UPI002D77D589|nr:hypothetical protein [Microbacterium sp.]HET6302139.1 hypothetical protein [Microbacterium sp.]
MDQLELWKDFNVAMVGATAALAGLVIVAASVNIAEIIKASTLTARLAAAIATLVLAITTTGAGLIPGIAPRWYGAIVLVAALLAGGFQIHAASRIARDRSPQVRMRLANSTLGFLPLVAYAIGGVLLLLSVPDAMIALAVGTLTAIVSAIGVSWVALVEVLR